MPRILAQLTSKTVSVPYLYTVPPYIVPYLYRIKQKFRNSILIATK